MFFSLPNIPELRKSFQHSESTPSRLSGSSYFLPSLRQEKKSVLLPSKSLFTTVLKEETEEIVEDDPMTEVQTPMSDKFSFPATTTNKIPKTISDLRSFGLKQTTSELVEENKLRGNRMVQYLEELSKLSIDQEFQLDTECQFRERKSNSDLRDRIIRLGENMLTIYNIQLNIVGLDKQDSIMKINKLKDRFMLAKTLEAVAKEVAKFPYSFFKKIGLTSITICQDIELYKPQRNPIVIKKILNGIFPLAKLATPENVVDHLYKVMFTHLRAKAPDLDNHWAKVYIRKSKVVMHVTMKVVVTQSTETKKSFFDEQWKLFKNLVLLPNTAIKNESNLIRIKAFKLKECLEGIDPDGITEAWWKKRGLTLLVGSLDHI